MEKIDALIIEPYSYKRMRLHFAMKALPQAGRIEQYGSFEQARSALKEGAGATVIFIASDFEEELSQEFIRCVKETKRGANSAFIMTMRAGAQSSMHVTKGLLEGIDGFLFEPYSVNSLAESCTIAQSIYRIRRRERYEKAIELAVKDIVTNLEEVYGHVIVGRKPGVALRKLHNLGAFLRELDSDLLPLYVEALTKACASAPPRTRPKTNHEQIVERRREKLEARQQPLEAEQSGEKTAGTASPLSGQPQRLRLRKSA